MTQHPPRSPTVPDERSPAFLAGDRASLEHWLDFARQTLPLKVGGLTAEQLYTRSVPPSTLTLLGLVRHLSKVERFWSLNVMAGQTEAPRLYCADDPDGDFRDGRPATALADLERYHVEVDAARERAAAVTDLDATLPGLWRGNAMNLRWVLSHLAEEYARHLGHVDLLRECLDGATGY